jgi:hypothetical protein
MPSLFGPDLAALQADMARALLSGRYDGLAAAVQSGPITAEEALGVHRNTALHGLVNALRLDHPTVDALVGADFFDQAARAFIDAHPPTGAWLAGYGEAFADFLAGHGPAGELPYLADVARFDFALEQVGGAVSGLDGPALDLGAARLTLDGSLRLIALHYPAPAIRDAIREDEDRLADLDLRPCRHDLALWRLADGVGVRPIVPASAAFLAAVIAGQDPGDGLAEADLDALQSEVFAAPFVRLSLKT